jgi:plastocyanin
VPSPDPGPVPVALTITIVGSFGSNAFTPNPIQASVGDTIIWTNGDQTSHRIVLDDGAVIGDVAPGGSTMPMALMSATATYRCTIHPTMVGSINGEAAPEPPTSPSPPPPDDYYY